MTRRSGQALFVAIIFVGLIMALVLALSQIATTNRARATANHQGDALINAARAGLAQSRHELWSAYVESQGGTAGNPASFRAWLDTRGVSNGATADLGNLTLVPSALGGHMYEATVTRTAFRNDASDTSTFVVLTAVATNPGGERRQAEEVLRMGGQPFDGFRFALLSNNVNCIFCHTRIDNVTRYYGDKDGTHDRVRVASLETMMLRGTPDSRIAGTLYIQGSLVDHNGNVLPVPPGGYGQLQAYDIDSQGKIVDPSSTVNFQVAGTDASGNYNEQFANFYVNYSTDPAQQVDGTLPSSFPPVVADENANRTLDDGEWSTKAGTMTGTLTTSGNGALVTVDAGNTYGAGTLPGGTPGTFSSNTPDKNLILVGTAENPIVIDGDVAVDGDVVISGYVKGNGLLLARGNMYVVGDIIYADGTDADGNRTFGVAQDGTENTVAFAAGGNILHGQYNKDQNGVDSGTDGIEVEDGASFTVREMALFNRMEWTKTQPFYDPATEMPTSTDTGVPNSAYVAGHVPRYYTLNEGTNEARLWLGNDPGDPGNNVQWDNVNKVWTGAENGTNYTEIQLPPGQEGVQYVKKALNPTDGWISEENILAINRSYDASRPQGPYEIDGLLYSDNAIFMIARDKNTDGSNTTSNGQAIVNGAIVSADTGILVPGSQDTSIYPFSEWNEATGRTAAYEYNEATFGLDLNRDGDIGDRIRMDTLYANRAAWGWNVTRTGSGSSTRYRLDANEDGDVSDRVRYVPPGYESEVGLQLNYDARTRNYLVIEDTSQVQLFTVGRREF